jgi:hypothetical protein
MRDVRFEKGESGDGSFHCAADGLQENQRLAGCDYCRCQRAEATSLR